MARTTVVLLAVVIFAAFAGVHCNGNGEIVAADSSARTVGSSNQFVCNASGDPDVCVSNLAGFSGLPHLIPTELLNVAVKAAIGIVGKAYAMAVGLAGRAAPGLEQSALQDCIEL